MSTTTERKNMPSWAIPALICVIALVLLIGGWKAWSSSRPAPAASVRPGMVDFRKEAQKGAIDRPRSEADEDDKAAPAKPGAKEKDGDNDGDGK